MIQKSVLVPLYVYTRSQIKGGGHVGMQCCSYGYDPLGLGKDTAQVEKYREYELIHARWAMLAAAGIIIPEGLQVDIMPFLCASSLAP